MDGSVRSDERQGVDSVTPNKNLAFASVAAAAILFGVAGAASKFLFNQDISPTSLTIIRTVVAAAIFFTHFRFARTWRPLARRDIAIMALLGFLTFSVTYTFYRAIDEAGVAVAIMLQYTAPAFVILIEYFSKGQQLTKARLAALALSTLGCLFLVGGHEPQIGPVHGFGIAVGLACGALFAVYNIALGRAHERRLSDQYITTYSFAFAAAFALAVAPTVDLGVWSFGPDAWFSIAFISVFATVIPYKLYVSGLKVVPAFQATVVGMLDPVAAACIAALFLGEHLNLLQLIGITSILTATLLARRGE